MTFCVILVKKCQLVHYQSRSALLEITPVSTSGERQTRDAESTKDLEPEVVEFCHMLARILARSARLPSHEADTCTEQLKGDPGMITRDV
jgi:hypothetical protein